jgi:CRISPR-associated protein Cas5d
VIEESKQRQQRVSLVLKDVEYVIEAEMNLFWKDKAIGGYFDQFERRLNRGAYHHAPYLGTREFSAWFEPATGNEQPNDEAVIRDMYLGVMFFDTAFVMSENRRDMRFWRHSFTQEGQKRVPRLETGGYPHYLFYPAKVDNNLVIVPAEKYQELYRLEGADV